MLNKLMPALLQLAGLYETGIGPVAADTDKAIRYYLLASELGSSSAQARLAQIYFALGKTDLAEQYAELAAKQKNQDALRVLQKLHADDKSEDDKQKSQQPESNPDSPSPVVTMVGTATTIES